MTAPRSLRRLLQIRELEEEEIRAALETRARELRRLEVALAATQERGCAARRLILESAQSGELADRLAGIEETRTSVRNAEALSARIPPAEREVATLRQRLLLKRIEHRQAQTLAQEMEARASAKQARRIQQTLDDWHRDRSPGSRDRNRQRAERGKDTEDSLCKKE